MARDAFLAEELWKGGDLKIQGPPTSTPGLYHGVLYYYLLAPFYGLGRGNPQFPAVALAVISSLGVFISFLLVQRVLKNILLGFVAALLFAVSFEATQYGPWLSNPQPALLTSLIFFWGLALWKDGKSWGLPLTILAAALSVQFQFFMVYLFLLIPIFYSLFKPKIEGKYLLYGLILAILVLSTFLISILKFQTVPQTLNAFLNLSTGNEINFRPAFSTYLITYLDRFSNIFINNFLPISVTLGGILGLGVIFIAKANRFILFALFSHLPIFLYGGHNSNFTNIGMAGPAILGVVLMLKTIAQKSWVLSTLLMTLIIITNLYMIFKVAPLGQKLMVIPQDMILGHQLKLIDQTYQVAAGQPFSINTLTLPLWTNTTWAYLYHWYGESRYGYLPKFHGRDPVGQLGERIFNRVDNPEKLSFFIIEPPEGIYSQYRELEIGSENSKTKVVKTFNWGTLILEQRELLTPPGNTPQPI